MKHPWIIDQYGMFEIHIIYVYNWIALNKIGMAGYTNNYTSGVPTENLVAIFKVKYKS